MRISKKGQYALLFTIYLQRSGLARTEDVSANLGLPHHFIEQIARNLKNAGIIKVKRGPGGGYEITQGTSPTVAQVLTAVGIPGLLTKEDTNENLYRLVEGRILNHIVGAASTELSSVFNQPISAFASSLVSQEVAQLNSIPNDSVAS